MNKQGCASGTLVSLGRFTRECREAAQAEDGLPVKLIDSKRLLELLCEYRIGVTRQSVSLYHIDEEYFSSSRDTSETSEN
jgi:restriction system protein